MIIMAVDDERPALWTLEKAIQKAVPDAEIACFLSVGETLSYARENAVDVAFLDIEMDEMDGLALAKRLKDIRGETNVIFVTGYSHYSLSAFALHASGYVLKPIDPQRVAQEMENLRQPVTAQRKGPRAQCFGNFELFVDEKPVIFNRPKAKEILAYLIDRRGASVDKKELAAVLWEGTNYSRSVQSHLHVLLTDMMRVLAAHGVEDIIIRHRGQYAVDTQKISCDYYDYIQGDVAAVNSYRGEYMANFIWAEFTTGLLTRQMCERPQNQT